MPQSLASVLIHLVFSTKHREPVICPEIEPELFAYMGGILRALRSPMLETNGTCDHVHILFRLARTISIADLVEEVKKRSSSWIKGKDAAFEGFYWQNGYGAFSIGESGVEALRTYIRRQKEHHQKRSFQEEYRSLCRLYGLDMTNATSGTEPRRGAMG